MPKTSSELIAEAEAITANLNSALTASYLTPGTFITGRLVMCHEDKYHHADQHPVPSMDYLELTGASPEVIAIVAELNAKVAEIHEEHIDTTGRLVYAHQDEDETRKNPSLRSMEVIGINLTFTDHTEHVAFCASTKLPHNVGEREDHKAAVAEGMARYDELLASKAAFIPPEHYRPGKAPPL
jgi:hypothetical protein